MPEKKDFSQDANSVFPIDVTKKPTEKAAIQQAAASSLEDDTRNSPYQKPVKDGSVLIRRTYYITEDIYRELKIKAAISDNPEEKDQSAIVRAALTQYLDL